MSTRRRIYLLRHAEVAYFDEDGQPVAPDEVPLTPAGRHQAEQAGAALAGVRFDRVLTSGLPRTVETAHLVLTAASAVETASQTLRDLRIAEVVQQDLVIEDGRVRAYRTRLKVSFKYVRGGEA